MKIEISRKVLADALSELAPLAGKKQALMILSNVKCVVKGNRMRMQASDGTMTIRKHVELVSSETDGEFITDCASLNNLVGKVKDDYLVLTYEDNTLTVKHGKGKAKFPAQPADDFPEVKIDEEATEFNIPANKFIRLLTSAKGFVSTETLRPIMCVVRVKIENGILNMSASDTHQLFTDSASVESGDLNIEWNVEQYAFSSLIKACRKEEAIIVRISAKNAQYRCGDTTIFTQLTQGNFPNIARVIPHTHNIEATCDKAEILDSLSRVMMFTEQSKVIRINTTPMTMDISVDNLDTMRSAKESVGCTSDGEIIFGVNVAYFINCLNACESREVIIQLSDSSRPVVIKDKENPERTILCMPMQLVNN